MASGTAQTKAQRPGVSGRVLVSVAGTGSRIGVAGLGWPGVEEGPDRGAACLPEGTGARGVVAGSDLRLLCGDQIGEPSRSGARQEGTSGGPALGRRGSWEGPEQVGCCRGPAACPATLFTHSDLRPAQAWLLILLH